MNSKMLSAKWHPFYLSLNVFYLITEASEYHVVSSDTHSWLFLEGIQTTSGSSQLSMSLRPTQNGCHSPDNIFKCIFLNENVWILIEISLKIVPKGPINNIPALVQIMAWRRPGNKPLPEPMLVSLLTHICVTRPQWVNQMHQWVHSSD